MMRTKSNKGKSRQAGRRQVVRYQVSRWRLQWNERKNRAGPRRRQAGLTGLTGKSTTTCRTTGNKGCCVHLYAHWTSVKGRNGIQDGKPQNREVQRQMSSCQVMLRGSGPANPEIGNKLKYWVTPNLA